MKKSEQIKALQAECNRLTKERDAYRTAVADAHARMRYLKTELAKRDQPLIDRVRSELHDRWGWLLEAAGL